MGLAKTNMWLTTPADWVCPCCGRPKPDFIKPDTPEEKRSLLLNEHHDHMDQYVANTAKELAKEQEIELPEGAYWFLWHKLAPFVRRFERILICVDCNNADVAAKAVAEMPESFSFTPNEIAYFIKPTLNNKHQIDRHAVLSIVDALKEDFFYRKELADVLIKRVIAGRVWGEMPVGASRQQYGFMKQFGNFPMEAWDYDLFKDMWLTTDDRIIGSLRRKLQKKIDRRAERICERSKKRASQK